MVTPPMFHRQAIHPSNLTGYRVQHHIDYSHLDTNQVNVRAVAKKSAVPVFLAQTLATASNIRPEPQQGSQTDCSGFKFSAPLHKAIISEIFIGVKY